MMVQIAGDCSLAEDRERGRGMKSADPGPNVGPKPWLVSVIVATKNSESTIRKCLESVWNQTYRPIEVIVVDQYSSDSTVAIAKEFTDRVYHAGPERGPQYNLGFRVAKGDLLYRIDSDFVLEPDVIREAVALISQGYDAVVVPNEPDPSISFWARVRTLEGRCYHDDEWNVAARFFKAPILRSLGGFDEDLVAGEDYDLHNRLLLEGYRVGRITSREIHLGEPRSLKDVYGKYFYYGQTIREFLRRDRGRGTRQLLPLRTAYIRHWRDFLRQPDLTAGFLVYQIVKYVAAWRGWRSSENTIRKAV